MQENQAQGEMPSEIKASPICSNRDCIKDHDGKRLIIQGVFSPKKRKEQLSQDKIVLGDTSVVVLVLSGEQRKKLEARAGQAVEIEGIVYCANIPEKYRIIGRTGDPYMVEVIKID